jgi:hypothetical protein
MRKNHGDDYGRIVRTEINVPTPEVKRMDVVTEKHEQDELSADPFLIEPAARAQFLGDTTLEPVTPVAAATTIDTTQPQQAWSHETRTVIVGGADGVAVVREERPKPVLGGGFGKQ